MNTWNLDKPSLNDQTECGLVIALIDDEGVEQFAPWLDAILKQAGARRNLESADSVIDLLFDLGLKVYVLEQGRVGETGSLFIGATDEDPAAVKARAETLLG